MNGENVRLAKGEATHVLVEIDEFLQRHAVGRSLVVGVEQFLLVMNFVDVFPAAARKRLQDRGAADIIEQPVPVHGIFQVVERLSSDVHVDGITLLRKEHGFGNRDAEFGGHRIVEILVVGGPPERIVDNVSPLKHRVLQVAAIIFDFMRDTVDDDAIARGLTHARAAQFHKFGGHAVLDAELLHAFDKRWRKTVFPSAE